MTKIGVFGGGQLAQMMALAAEPLGFRLVCFSEQANVSASGVSEIVVGKISDHNAVKNFAQSVDVLTIENENIDCHVLEFAQQFAPVFPSIESLRVSQDRFLEKNFLRALKIPTAEFTAVESEKDLAQAAKQFDFNAILKTCRFGYDGKGQATISSEKDLNCAKELLTQNCILEKKVPFDCEVSQIATRGRNGEIVFYPLGKNFHCDGILRTTIAPFKNAHLEQKAKDYCQRILTAVNYVGTLAIEFFVCANELIANEIAPRVHNSGHWTREGALTCQFENHIRAIVGEPLGDTSTLYDCAMINMIGTLLDRSTVLKIPGVSFTTYHKSARPKRKLGHLSVVASSSEDLLSRVQQLEKLIGND